MKTLSFILTHLKRISFKLILIKQIRKDINFKTFLDLKNKFIKMTFTKYQFNNFCYWPSNPKKIVEFIGGSTLRLNQI